MKQKDFLSALRDLGDRAGRDLAPGDGASFDYEFDDGLACTVGYLDDAECAVMVATIGALPSDAKDRLAVCELLLQWNNALNGDGAGRFAVAPDDSRVLYSLALTDGDLETDRLEGLFTGFLDQAAAFREHLRDINANTADEAPGAAPLRSGGGMIRG